MEQAPGAAAHGVLELAEVGQRFLDEGVQLGQRFAAVDGPSEMVRVRLAEAAPPLPLRSPPTRPNDRAGGGCRAAQRAGRATSGGCRGRSSTGRRPVRRRPSAPGGRCACGDKNAPSAIWGGLRTGGRRRRGGYKNARCRPCGLPAQSCRTRRAAVRRGGIRPVPGSRTPPRRTAPSAMPGWRESTGGCRDRRWRYRRRGGRPAAGRRRRRAWRRRWRGFSGRGAARSRFPGAPPSARRARPARRRGTTSAGCSTGRPGSAGPRRRRMGISQPALAPHGLLAQRAPRQ